MVILYELFVFFMISLYSISEKIKTSIKIIIVAFYSM